MITNEHIEQFIVQAHRVGDAGLTICSSGNISWRIGDEVLLSGTGSWVPSLPKEKVAVCRLSTGEVLNGVKPSMESGFHLGVLRERPDVNVVLHFQSHYATAVACMKNRPTNFNVTAEIPCHVGSEIPVVPYYRPGSKELAQGVIGSRFWRWKRSRDGRFHLPGYVETGRGVPLSEPPGADGKPCVLGFPSSV